jgi:creatinine amidohydrolase
MNDESPASLVLDEMTWVDVAAHLARDARLIIPIGALEQHGPNLPLGANTLIAARIAARLSAIWGVLRAPTVNYGVNFDGGQVRPGRAWSGTASLRRKTMHRALNELLDSWESNGIAEFILITAHRYGPHVDALTTLMTRSARVRVVSVWDVDIADLLDTRSDPDHTGEPETSVMLHLCPERVSRVRPPVELPGSSPDTDASPPDLPKQDIPGAAAVLERASAETGRLIVDRMLEVIGRAVFAARQTVDSDTL